MAKIQFASKPRADFYVRLKWDTEAMLGETIRELMTEAIESGLIKAELVEKIGKFTYWYIVHFP
jgi:hypothetical protein